MCSFQPADNLFFIVFLYSLFMVIDPYKNKYIVHEDLHDLKTNSHWQTTSNLVETSQFSSKTLI